MKTPEINYEVLCGGGRKRIYKYIQPYFDIINNWKIIISYNIATLGRVSVIPLRCFYVKAKLVLTSSSSSFADTSPETVSHVTTFRQNKDYIIKIKKWMSSTEASLSLKM